MNENRINQLLTFIKDDPSDPFPKYALALEYLQEKPEESIKLFEELLDKHPEYIGTYYHAAALFAKHGETDAAQATYQRGISMAQKNGESHALKELQSAYLNFQFENE